MSRIRIKTTYAVMGFMGSTEYVTLYCEHYNTTDTVTFYNEDGSVAGMIFHEWESGNDMWDAVNRLMFPYAKDLDLTGQELKDGIEYCTFPWLNQNTPDNENHSSSTEAPI